MRRLGMATVMAVGLLLATPATAFAHGIGGRLDLPVPLSYFLAAGAVVLVVSFVALAVLWPTPRLQGDLEYQPTEMRVRGGGILSVLGVLGLVLVVGQLVPPLLGLTRDTTRPTIAPVLLWVVFWLVVPFGSVLIGNWYSNINPWRSMSGVFGIGRSESGSITSKLGVLPAAVVFVGLAWFELISGQSGSPATIGAAALGYTIVILVWVAVTGLETGLTTLDMFTIYNRLLSSISPIGRAVDGRLVWRGWLRALPALPEWRGLPVFVVVAIGTVTYDGAANTSLFKNGLGDFGQGKTGRTLLLLGTIGVIGLAYWFASSSAARLGGPQWTGKRVSSRFAHSLVPIAFAYALAHYLTLIIFEGQQLIAAVSDPFGLGWDLFGAASRKVDFFITAPEPIWYAQVAVIVCGHLLGVVLAHDRALADFGKEAVRSQYAMLVLMVGLTILGLTILAA
jgi:hypothetical protein